MNKLIVGDIFVGGDVTHNLSISVNSEKYSQSDVVLGNVEHPFADTIPTNDKCLLYAPLESVSHLSELNITHANLANNHIHDAGTEAIHRTRELIQQRGIKVLGLGFADKPQTPTYLDQNLAVLSYCDYDKKYLKDVQVATADTIGVHALRRDNILRDLSGLPGGSKAILYMHWGKEHSWLPPTADIDLTKELLAHEKVLTIIGCHPHRLQGKIRANGKVAYMSLGNFLFPNFYIKPHVTLCYPSETELKYVRHRTTGYHQVFETTYKVWPWINRISIGVSITGEAEITDCFFWQAANGSKVTELKGLPYLVLFLFTSTLSLIYMLPKSIYRIIFNVHTYIVDLFWNLKTLNCFVKQAGIYYTLKKVFRYVLRQK